MLPIIQRQFIERVETDDKKQKPGPEVDLTLELIVCVCVLFERRWGRGLRQISAETV